MEGEINWMEVGNFGVGGWGRPGLLLAMRREMEGDQERKMDYKISRKSKGRLGPSPQ